MNLISILARRELLVTIKQGSTFGVWFLNTASAASAGITKKEVLARRLLVSSSTMRTSKRVFSIAPHHRESEVDYNDYEGHRFAQDLDEMYKATNVIEESLQALKEARAKHLKIIEGGGIPPKNFSDLLKQASDQEAVLSNQLEILREHMANARRELLAVDAPDGTPDFEVDQSRRVVQQIIDYAAEHEDVEKVLNEHQQAREDRARAMKTLAVDAPDGVSDDEQMVEIDAVENIIDFAAEHEDVEKVVKMHKIVQEENNRNLKVLAVDAPDGISDDEVKVDMEAIENIINFAAEHEDVDDIVARHQRERKEYLARMERIRDENSW